MGCGGSIAVHQLQLCPPVPSPQHISAMPSQSQHTPQEQMIALPERQQVPADREREDADTLSKLTLAAPPRNIKSACTGLPNTPMGKQAEEYKYTCPICFNYFKEIWKTCCCGNLICQRCALAHINSMPPITPCIDFVFPPKFSFRFFLCQLASN